MMPTPRTQSDLTSALDVRPLNVVMVDEEIPYPPVSGKRIRTLGLVERLADRHQITYVAHRNADPQEARTAVQHFNSMGIRTVVVDRVVPARSGLRFYGRLAANLLSPLPYSVVSHTSKELRDALQQVASTEPVDLWHCEWTPYAQALRGIPGRRVVMAHNVESVIWQRYAETETNPLKRWYIRQQWKKFYQFEKNILNDANLTIAVSEVDADRFRDEMGIQSVDVVDNGVDTARFLPPTTPRNEATLLFLGSLEWRPNLDAVKQLLEIIFPAVKAQVPQARLQLVGRNPPEWVTRQAATISGVEVHANVPDVMPFLHQASMMVVPLRIGGGSRLKILESLATATPVVSTRVGAEGLHLDAGRHLDIVDDNRDMAPVIINALRNRYRTQEMASAGRKQVLRLYDWSVLADRLEQLWKRCVQEAPTTM